MTVCQTDGWPSEGLAEDCQVTGCGPAETMRCMREEHGSWRVTWERCEAAGAWGRERGTRACARYMSPLPDNAACDARARSSPVRACSRGPMREYESRGVCVFCCVQWSMSHRCFLCSIKVRSPSIHLRAEAQWILFGCSRERLTVSRACVFALSRHAGARASRARQGLTINWLGISKVVSLNPSNW